MGRLRSACIFFLMTTSCVISASFFDIEGGPKPWTKAQEEAWHAKCEAEATEAHRRRMAQEAEEARKREVAKAAKDAAEAESCRRFVSGLRNSGLLDILAQQMTEGGACPLPGGSPGSPSTEALRALSKLKIATPEDGSSFKLKASSSSA